MTSLRTQFVDGEWTETSSSVTWETRNPFCPREIVGEGENADGYVINRAIESSKRAQQSWRRVSPATRAEQLSEISAKINERHDELANLIAREVAKPISEARAEVLLAAHVLRYFAGQALLPDGFAIPSQVRSLSLTKRFPIGVVGAITPFNFPLSIPMWKMAPAIANGCAVIWKPAPAAIEIASVVTEIINSVLPPGVVNLINGDASTVAALLASGLDGVTFTGSTEVGRLVSIKCAELLIPLQCEMGGKNALVVMRDADLEAAAKASVSGAFGYGGQKCTATSRLLIDTSIWDSFLSEFESAVEEIKLGDPLIESTSMGPLISIERANSLHSTAADAVTRLGSPLVGRRAPQGLQAWCDLNLFGPANSNDPLAITEYFGPIVVAIPIGDIDEAISINNSIPFGLTSSIFTSNLQSAMEFCSEAKSGMVRVNRGTTGLDVGVPFGGEGTSGIGEKELGFDASNFSTRSRSIWFQ